MRNALMSLLVIALLNAVALAQPGPPGGGPHVHTDSCHIGEITRAESTEGTSKTDLMTVEVVVSRGSSYAPTVKFGYYDTVELQTYGYRATDYSWATSKAWADGTDACTCGNVKSFEWTIEAGASGCDIEDLWTTYFVFAESWYGGYPVADSGTSRIPTCNLDEIFASNSTFELNCEHYCGTGYTPHDELGMVMYWYPDGYYIASAYGGYNCRYRCHILSDGDAEYPMVDQLDGGWWSLTYVYNFWSGWQQWESGCNNSLNALIHCVPSTGDYYAWYDLTLYCEEEWTDPVEQYMGSDTDGPKVPTDKWVNCCECE